MKKEHDRLATGTLRADLNGHRGKQPPLSTEGNSSGSSIKVYENNIRRSIKTERKIIKYYERPLGNVERPFRFDAHLRGLEAGHQRFEATLQGWLTFGDNAFKLIDPRIEPQASHTDIAVFNHFSNQPVRCCVCKWYFPTKCSCL